MATPSRFGVRLREFRERAGLSVPELSDRSGVPRATIYGLEDGTRTGLTALSAYRIARVLSISVDRLIGDAFEAEIAAASV